MAKMSTTSITTYRCLVPKERAEIDLSRWLLRSQLPHIGGLLRRSKNTLLIHTQVSEKNHPVQYGDQSLAPRAILSGLVPTVEFRVATDQIYPWVHYNNSFSSRKMSLELSVDV